MKPLLFHDIDGVLRGSLTPDIWDDRPGIAFWLRWAHDQFAIHWLTSCRPKDVATLCTHAGVPEVWDQSTWVPWSSEQGKLTAILQSVPPWLPWLWIDDEPLTRQDLARLTAAGHDPFRFLRVRPIGALPLYQLPARVVVRCEQLARRTSPQPSILLPSGASHHETDSLS